MIGLLIDGLTSVVKILDRALTAVDQNVRRHATLPRRDVGAQPAGVAETGPGGHPIRSTSELLYNAVSELDYAYPERKHAVIIHLQHELADRAALFQAEGD